MYGCGAKGRGRGTGSGRVDRCKACRGVGGISGGAVAVGDVISRSSVSVAESSYVHYFGPCRR